MKSFTIHHLPFTLLVIGCLGLLTSCNRDTVYCAMTPIADKEWHVDSVAHFDYAIEDTAADYRVLIHVRHTERYPYQNMWLFLSDGQQGDTIEFYLADDRGQWLGDKHHGFVEMPVLIEQNRRFSQPGEYHLEIRHAMRDSILRGVSDIGLEIIRNGEK